VPGAAPGPPPGGNSEHVSARDLTPFGSRYAIAAQKEAAPAIRFAGAACGAQPVGQREGRRDGYAV